LVLGIFGVAVLAMLLVQGPRSLSQPTTKHTENANLDKSIAVLPFVNFSADEQQEYFSDGITEDILNQLSKIADLKVKSRTSVLRYKNTEKPIPEIGRELGVGNILEGSVRKSGNKVRIVAQLINVTTDEQIWSETYDRELTEVFAIQTEVAIEIARVLQAKLTASEQNNISKEATSNFTAYDYYLKARQKINSSNNWEADLPVFLQLLDQAIELDPNFALAYALKAYTLYRSRGWGSTQEVWLDSSLALIEKAIAIDPDGPEAYILRHSIYLDRLGDEVQSSKDLNKAYQLDPNNPTVLNALGDELIRKQEYDRGAALLIRALELELNSKDPQYYIAWGDIYHSVDEYEMAIRFFEQARLIAPEWVAPLTNLADVYRDMGDYKKTIEYCERARQVEGITAAIGVDIIAWSYFMLGDLNKAEEYWQLLLEAEKTLEDSTQFLPARHRLAMVKRLQGEEETARELVAEQIMLGHGALENENVVWNTGTYYDLAISELFRGNIEEGYRWLDRAWEEQSWMGLWFLDHDPMFDSIRHEMRFQSLVAKVRNREDQIKAAFRKQLREREASRELNLEILN
jgi:TolB-like protein/Flp pilus assembly protein TadD